MGKDVVIVSGARTPIGRFGGAFKDMAGSELGGIAIRAAVERAGIAPGLRRRAMPPAGPC